MTTDELPYLNAVGYLIVEDSGEVRRRYGRNHDYYGVDRMPYFLPPDPVIRESFGEPQVPDEGLRKALDLWFEYDSGTIAFIPRAVPALQLVSTLRSYDYDLQLLFCELAWAPGEEQRLEAYAACEEPPPAVSVTYGYDVSWPSARHSAVFQPGVVPDNPDWLRRLNRWGLLSNYADAVELRAQYCAIYPYPPFDIYLVHQPAFEQQ